MYPAAYPSPGNKDRNFEWMGAVAADRKMIELSDVVERAALLDMRRLATVSYIRNE